MEIDYTILFLKLPELDDNTMVIQAPPLKNFSFRKALFDLKWVLTVATETWHLSSQQCDRNSELNMIHKIDF